MDFPLVALGEVCTQDRSSIRTGERPELRYIGMESIESHSGRLQNGALSKTPEVPQANSFHFDRVHVLYGKLRPYLNKVYVPDFEGKCSTEIIPLRPHASLNRDYLAYFLRSPHVLAQINARTSGARMPRADMDFVLGLRLPLPSIPEQLRTVDILSRAEGIMRLCRDAQDKAAAMIPAIFHEMFGDPMANPKEFPIRRLDSVAHVGSGSGFPIVHQGKTTGQYPFYKVSDMNREGNKIEMRAANNYITGDEVAILKATLFPAGTVIFPKIGAAIGTNKKRILTADACFDNNVMGIVPGPAIASTYLHALMAGKNISDFASDSNPPSIRKTTVEGWTIPIPSAIAQKRFADRVAAVRSIQHQQSMAASKAQDTFDALLAHTFSVSNGEVNG